MKTLFLAIVIAIAAPAKQCNPTRPNQNGNGVGNNNHSTHQTVTVPEGGTRLELPGFGPRGCRSFTLRPK